MENSSKKRDSSIELLRIITMLLIIAHHYVVNSGLMSSGGPVLAKPTSTNSIFLLLFGMWGKIGINCFIIITGYFMCEQRITTKKFAKLLLEWFFYRYAIMLVFLLSGYATLGWKDIIKWIIPITQIDKGFTTCFFMFYLCIPFLNILVKQMTKQQHLRLLVLTGFIYIALGTIHSVSFNYVTWFSVLYIIASYIRFYPMSWMNNKAICGVGLLGGMSISAISVVLCAAMGKSPFYFVTDSNTVLAVITGVLAFLYFKNLHITYVKTINTVATTTFGVLLIHANSDVMRRWLWQDVIDCVGHYPDKLMPIYAVLCVIGVFLVCSIIDLLRINLLERPVLKMLDKKLINTSK